MTRIHVRTDGQIHSPSADQPLSVCVIVPVYNSAGSLARCLDAICNSTYPHTTCIVVDDSSTDASPAIAAAYPVQVVTLQGGPSGPAHARNVGAEAATSDIVFFVDADVVIAPKTVADVADSLRRHPHYAAVFGSYDEEPASGEFVSQFKNLSHHFVHQHGQEDAATFWSGCGAVRRTIFLELGGFDTTRYPRPSIEDIELGYRLRKAGHRILLNKKIQVKHLKRWTLRTLIKADIFDRGIPWTQLILEYRSMPNDLNLGRSQRFSGVLLCALLLLLGVAAVVQKSITLALLIPAYLVVIGYWQYPASVGSLQQKSVRAQTAAWVLLGSTLAVALYYGATVQFALLLPAFVGLIGGRRLTMIDRAWSNRMFVAAVFGFIGAGVLATAQATPLITVPALGIALCIIALNYQFYRFFARRRDAVFAIATIPFHMLYYLYSLVSLVLGTALYVYQFKTAGVGAVGHSRLTQ